MKKGVVLFSSKYGAARRYAAWLAEAASFDCMEIKKADISQVASYDTVVLCGGVYASGIAGLSFLKKHYPQLKDKKLAVFAVGASPYEEDAVRALFEHNMKEDLRPVKGFYGRGTWNESAMTFRDRMLCKMMHKAVAGKDPASFEPWMVALLSTQGQKCDWTDKAYLAPLLEYIR